MLNGLDLFSGIGGITEGLAGYVLPLAYCENDSHAQANLVSRIYRGELPSAPIWDDVRTLRAAGLPEVDIIYGGFPCQDISTAGRGGGLEGKRSGLYWQIHRLVKECEPSFVFLENVPAIRTRGLDTVVRSLTDLGYGCRWDVVSAAEVGAWHLRKRWFLLAHSDRKLVRHESGRERRENRKGPDVARYNGPQGLMGDTDSSRLALRQKQSAREELAPAKRAGHAMAHSASKRQREPSDEADALAARGEAWHESVDRRASMAYASSGGRHQGYQDTWWSSGGACEGPQEWSRSTDRRRWWDVEPDVGRVAYGVPLRSDRLRGLGNAVVPLQARIAFERLMGFRT